MLTLKIPSSVNFRNQWQTWKNFINKKLVPISSYPLLLSMVMRRYLFDTWKKEPHIALVGDF